MGRNQDSYRLFRTALAEQEYPLRPTVHSWSAILPPLLTYPPSKMPWRQCRPSCTQRSTTAARAWDLQSCALMPEDAHCPSAATISTSLSTTIDRSQYPFSIVGEATKSWATRQGRSKEGRSRISWDTILSAFPKASGNLAHHRYPHRWRLSYHACSCHNPIGTSSADVSNALLEPRMILSSRISPDPRNQTNTKCATAWGNLQEAAYTSSTCGAARQKPGRVIVGIIML